MNYTAKSCNLCHRLGSSVGSRIKVNRNDYVRRECSGSLNKSDQVGSGGEVRKDKDRMKKKYGDVVSLSSGGSLISK